MSKNMKKNKKQNNSVKKRFIIVFFLILLSSISIAFVSYQNKDNKKEEKKETRVKKEIETPKNVTKKNIDDFSFEKIKIQEKNKEEVKKIKDIEKKDNTKKQVNNKKIDKKEVKEKKQTKQIKLTKKDLYKYDKKARPKLAIIIDDVSSSHQKKKILDIGYKVAMSFLPPTKGHKNSAKIAQDLPFHMIHFPMQASDKFKGKEENTLNITDSYEKIEKRVKDLRRWYPKAKYTNNHTGSVFTSNDIAMDRLFKALKKYDFIFMDSKTSPKSVVKKYAIKYDMPYIVRNTFLDNKKDYVYIQTQLKKAIKKAKKKGYAIAIGHPHSMTIKVLKESKHLLKNIDLIYIDELPYLR